MSKSSNSERTKSKESQQSSSSEILDGDAFEAKKERLRTRFGIQKKRQMLQRQNQRTVRVPLETESDRPSKQGTDQESSASKKIENQPAAGVGIHMLQPEKKESTLQRRKSKAVTQIRSNPSSVGGGTPVKTAVVALNKEHFPGPFLKKKATGKPGGEGPPVRIGAQSGSLFKPNDNSILAMEKSFPTSSITNSQSNQRLMEQLQQLKQNEELIKQTVALRNSPQNSGHPSLSGDSAFLNLDSAHKVKPGIALNIKRDSFLENRDPEQLQKKLYDQRMQQYDSEYYENVFAQVESSEPIRLIRQIKCKSPLLLLEEINKTEQKKLHLRLKEKLKLPVISPKRQSPLARQANPSPEPSSDTFEFINKDLKEIELQVKRDALEQEHPSMKTKKAKKQVRAKSLMKGGKSNEKSKKVETKESRSKSTMDFGFTLAAQQDLSSRRDTIFRNKESVYSKRSKASKGSGSSQNRSPDGEDGMPFRHITPRRAINNLLLQPSITVLEEKERREFQRRKHSLRALYNHYSGISGIHKRQETALKQDRLAKEELKYLEESGKILEEFSVPLKHKSNVVDYSKGNNQVHDINNEKSQSVMMNLISNLKYSKNPYFNKKMYTMNHGDYLNAISLYKLGQIGEKELKEEIEKIQARLKRESLKAIDSGKKTKKKAKGGKSTATRSSAKNDTQGSLITSDDNDSSEYLSETMQEKSLRLANIDGKIDRIEILDPFEIDRLNKIRLEHLELLKKMRKTKAQVQTVGDHHDVAQGSQIHSSQYNIDDGSVKKVKKVHLVAPHSGRRQTIAMGPVGKQEGTHTTNNSQRGRKMSIPGTSDAISRQSSLSRKRSESSQRKQNPFKPSPQRNQTSRQTSSPSKSSRSRTRTSGMDSTNQRVSPRSKWGGIFKERKEEIYKKYNKKKVEQFQGVKWDKQFLKKLYAMKRLQEDGEMFDDFRVDPTLFSFLEPDRSKDPTQNQNLNLKRSQKYENENNIMRLLRLKYSLHQKDVSPFYEHKKIDDLVIDPHMPKEQIEKNFQAMMKSILKDQEKKRDTELRQAQNISKHLDTKRFTQSPQKNCCYFPLDKYTDESILPDNMISNSLRTQTIILNALNQRAYEGSSLDHTMSYNTQKFILPEFTQSATLENKQFSDNPHNYMMIPSNENTFDLAPLSGDKLPRVVSGNPQKGMPVSMPISNLSSMKPNFNSNSAASIGAINSDLDQVQKNDFKGITIQPQKVKHAPTQIVESSRLDVETQFLSLPTNRQFRKNSQQQQYSEYLLDNQRQIERTDQLIQRSILKSSNNEKSKTGMEFRPRNFSVPQLDLGEDFRPQKKIRFRNMPNDTDIQVDQHIIKRSFEIEEGSEAQAQQPKHQAQSVSNSSSKKRNKKKTPPPPEAVTATVIGKGSSTFAVDNPMWLPDTESLRTSNEQMLNISRLLEEKKKAGESSSSRIAGGSSKYGGGSSARFDNSPYPMGPQAEEVEAAYGMRAYNIRISNATEELNHVPSAATVRINPSSLLARQSDSKKSTLAKQFNQRFKEKTLKQQINEYNTMRIQAQNMTKRIEKFIKRKATIQKRKVNAMISRQKALDIDMKEERQYNHTIESLEEEESDLSYVPPDRKRITSKLPFLQSSKTITIKDISHDQDPADIVSALNEEYDSQARFKSNKGQNLNPDSLMLDPAIEELGNRKLNQTIKKLHLNQIKKLSPGSCRMDHKQSQPLKKKMIKQKLII